MKQFDRADAERLVQTYSDLILRLAYTYLKSTHDAEDICQNIFLKLLTGGQTFDSPAHEKAWIIRATANACKDSLRLPRTRRKSVWKPLPRHPRLPHLDSDVLDAVMALPRKYREAVYLHYYEGYSVREIASLLGQSESAVSAHLSRGRKSLRTTLGGDLYEQRV